MFPIFTNKDELFDYLQDQDLVGLDSEFSGRSKALVERFGAQGFDLNKWWVYTPHSWVCPCCKRSKPDIVRLNQHGYLTGHLHEHHDHMADFVKDEFVKASESLETPVADALAQRFVVRTAFALSAYDPTVICSDCNAADAKAKALVKAHKDFSYSPAEIAQFVNVAPNCEHQINIEVARQLWAECQPVFATRVRMVSAIARIGASNKHWYQPSAETAKKTERVAEHWIDKYNLKALSYDPLRLLYSTNKFSGSQDRWRMRKRLGAQHPPSHGELQHLINISGHRWTDTADCWLCPICRRTKFQCVRKSNANVWSFQVVYKVFFCPTSEGLKQRLTICNDCSTAATHIAKEAEGHAGARMEEWATSALLPNEVGGVVIPQPHTKHGIDNEAVETLMPTLVERIKARHGTH